MHISPVALHNRNTPANTKQNEMSLKLRIISLLAAVIVAIITMYAIFYYFDIIDPRMAGMWYRGPNGLLVGFGGVLSLVAVVAALASVAENLSRLSMGAK